VVLAPRKLDVSGDFLIRAFRAERVTKSRNIREVARVDLDAKERLREKMTAMQG
jgi:hypothetical protein